MYNQMQRVHVKLFFFVIIVVVGMTTTVTFSRQNDAGSRACTTFSYLILKISRPRTKPRYKYRDIF